MQIHSASSSITFGGKTSFNAFLPYDKKGIRALVRQNWNLRQGNILCQVDFSLIADEPTTTITLSGKRYGGVPPASSSDISHFETTVLHPQLKNLFEIEQLKKSFGHKVAIKYTA